MLRVSGSGSTSTTIMRVIDQDAIKRHGSVRFRSEYHYAVFEYWRSAKVLAYMHRAGIDQLGRVLDDGCGGGGMSVSFAEEADVVVGIDLSDRFAHAGTKLAEERQVTNIRFVQADGSRLPFPTDDFNLVFSHAVIEHVSDPGSYLREARRVLRPGGRMLLQTAPYLSPSGVHLPRLKVPVPIHLLIGRPAAFRLSCWLAKHAPSSLQASHDDSAILAKARRGEANVDDLTYLVTLQNLRRHIADAGFAIVREDLEISKLAQRMLPEWLVNQIPSIPLGRDVLITNMEYLLA